MATEKRIWLNNDQSVAVPNYDVQAMTGNRIATRERTWDFSAMLGVLPDPDPVLMKMNEGPAILESILGDGHVTAVIQTRKLGTMSEPFDVSPGSIKEQEPDQASVDLCNDLREDLWKLDVDNLISQILDAPLMGMVPIEIVWKADAGKLRIADLIPVPCRWFGFDNDNKPRFLSGNNMIMGEPLPEGKFVFARHFPSYDNPYGIRLLSRCFWPAFFKRGGLKFWVQFVEKYASPFLHGKYQNPADADAMLSQLSNMVQSAVGVSPVGTEVNVVQGDGSASSDVYETFKTSMDSEISKIILGQTLTTEVGDKGTQALGTVHQTVLEAFRAADRKLIVKTFDEIAWIYQQLNNSAASSPIFAFQSAEDIKKDVADRDKVLSDMGTKFSIGYLNRRYGFEDGDIEAKPDPVPPTPFGGPAGPEGSPGKTPFAFAEGNPIADRKSFPDQVTLDHFIEGIPEGALRGIADDVVLPVVSMITSGDSYEAILGKLAELYPAMNSTGFEEILARAIFVADVWGRLNAGK
jgi:phage gp29-like protein